MSKIVFLNRYAPPDQSATSQILGDLAAHHAGRGCDVRILASDQLYRDPSACLPDKETINGVRIERLQGSSFGRERLAGRAVDYLTFYGTVRRRLSEVVEPGDIVVAKTDPPLLSVAVVGIVRRRGGRLVNWLQDVFPEVASALGVKLVSGPVSMALSRARDASLRRAHANVVLGARMRETLEARGIEPSSIVEIPNWSFDDVIAPIEHAENPLRREWGLERKFVVGYSGNLGRAHEYDTLLDAARRLGDRQDIVFLFIGDGHHLAGCKQKVARLGLGDRFQFRPYQPQEGLSLSLGVPDVHWISLRPELEGLVVPSKFYGIAAAGRPTLAIAAPDGEIGRIVIREGCGVQVTPGDGAGLANAILRLQADPEMRAHQGAAARALSRSRFTRKLSLERWSAVLDAIAAGKSVPTVSSL